MRSGHETPGPGISAQLNITGRNGKNLRDKWQNDSPTTYLGL